MSTDGVRNNFFVGEVNSFKFCELVRNMSQAPLPRHEQSTVVWILCL